MKNIFLNRVVKNFILMMIVLFSSEIIFRIVLNIPIFEWSLLRIFLGISIFSLILSVLYSFCGRVAGNVLTFLTCLAASIYALIQAGFENYLGVYMSVGTSTQAGAVTDYLSDYIKSFNSDFYFILIPVGVLFLYYLFLERKVKAIIRNRKYNVLEIIGGVKAKEDEKNRIRFEEKKKLRVARLSFLTLAVICGCLYYYSLTADFMQNKLQLISNKSLFNNPEMPNIAVNQFGIGMFGLLDVKAMLLPNNGLDDEFNSYTKPEQEFTDYTRYIDDTVWENLIESEKNSTYKKLHNYYISKEITPKNDYSGMFEGKNLIVVMMESVNNIVINEEYFPNIYKLYSEGWSWVNNYSPRNSCSTGNNEMSGMASIFTINRACTANSYKDNTYFNAIFNLFNRQGYTTSSYHNYTEQYYYRRTIHPNMGSMKYYNTVDLGIPYSNLYQEWPSDVTLMEKASDIFLQEEPFMAWITTVTSHQPYYQSSELGDLYLDEFSDTNYDITLKRYLSKLKTLDNAIGKLVEILDNAGKLEDTVIVLYADHYPYGLNNNVIESILDYDVDKNYEVDRTPFIIYNPTLTPTKFQEYTSYMNILPTVANLFNLNYDPRLYSGFDILSDEYQNRVVFADGSWQSPLGFYDAATGKMNYFGDDEYTDEEIMEINKEIMNNIKMSNLAITSNYFEYLGNKLVEGNAPIVNNSIIKEDDVATEENSEETFQENS